MLEYAFPYIFFAAAVMVDVFPVPGGPYRSKCGRLSLSIRFVMMLMISSWATKSSSLKMQWKRAQCESIVDCCFPPDVAAKNLPFRPILLNPGKLARLLLRFIYFHRCNDVAFRHGALFSVARTVSSMMFSSLDAGRERQ